MIKVVLIQDGSSGVRSLDLVTGLVSFMDRVVGPIQLVIIASDSDISIYLKSIKNPTISIVIFLLFLNLSFQISSLLMMIIIMLQVPPGMKESLTDLTTDVSNVQHLMACQHLTKVQIIHQGLDLEFVLRI